MFSIHKSILSICAVTALSLAVSAPAFAGDVVPAPKTTGKPAVKKSDSSSICHAKGTASYKRTKHFTAFDSMDECIKSGGKAPAAHKAKGSKAAKPLASTPTATPTK